MIAILIKILVINKISYNSNKWKLKKFQFKTILQLKNSWLKKFKKNLLFDFFYQKNFIHLFDFCIYLIIIYIGFLNLYNDSNNFLN